MDFHSTRAACLLPVSHTDSTPIHQFCNTISLTWLLRVICADFLPHIYHIPPFEVADWSTGTGPSLGYTNLFWQPSFKLLTLCWQPTCIKVPITWNKNTVKHISTHFDYTTIFAHTNFYHCNDEYFRSSWMRNGDNYYTKHKCVPYCTIC